jgi:hypothetical protein
MRSSEQIAVEVALLKIVSETQPRFAQQAA